MFRGWLDMRIVNTSLFTPRNFVVIGIIAAITHIVAKPLYNMIDSKGTE